MTNERVALNLSNVQKVLGRVTILNDLNLSVSYGEIVGIMGSNGVGKTLLLRIMCGLVYADSGVVEVEGKVLKAGIAGALPPDVGVVIETPGFLPYLSGIDNLELLALIRRRIDIETVRRVMREVGLDPDNRRPVKTYSMGMRQRLGIAQAIMERPRLLLLDEPTNALDPEYTEKFLQLLLDLRRLGTAIVWTSHETTEAAAVSDRVLTLTGGTLQSSTAAHGAGHRTQFRVVFRTLEDLERMAQNMPQFTVGPRVNGYPSATFDYAGRSDNVQLILDDLQISPVRVDVLV